MCPGTKILERKGNWTICLRSSGPRKKIKFITQEKQTLSFSKMAEDSGEWTEFSSRAELKTITAPGDRNTSKLSKNDCNGDSFTHPAMIKLL